jgi:hypothetical protein
MDALDVYGDQLFGRRIRLRVLLWADRQKQAFNQSEASKGVDYSSSGEVAKELERLVRLGMLRKFGRPSRVGPQNYVRVEHPGWAIASAARAAVHAGLKDEGDDVADEPGPSRPGRRPGPRGRLADVGGDDRAR